MNPRPQKKLTLLTSLFFFLVSSTIFFSHRSQLPESIVINTKGQPTIGHPKAPIHLVLFEEPKCTSCKEFSNLIFPKIKSDFIDTNKAKFSVMIVSFLPNSMPAAEALYGIYYSDPHYPNDDLFFKYLDYLYAHQPKESIDWTTPNRLIEFAKKTSPAINLQELRYCIDRETYRIQIEKNTEYALNLMNGTISTPTLYINGIKADTLTYDAIHSLIEKVLKERGGEL